MTSEGTELLELNRRAREHLNALVVAGIDERAATVATMVACIERMVAVGGRTESAIYLRKLAKAIDLGGFDFEAGQEG